MSEDAYQGVKELFLWSEGVILQELGSYGVEGVKTLLQETGGKEVTGVKLNACNTHSFTILPSVSTA